MTIYINKTNLNAIYLNILKLKVKSQYIKENCNGIKFQ